MGGTPLDKPEVPSLTMSTWDIKRYADPVLCRDRVLIFVGCQHVDSHSVLTRGGVASEMTAQDVCAMKCAALEALGRYLKASY